MTTFDPLPEVGEWGRDRHKLQGGTVNIFRLFSNDTTTSWAQSASASCTGWFCRASASNVIAPTVADEIAGMLSLVAAGCAVILIVAFVGWLACWWGHGEQL